MLITRDTACWFPRLRHVQFPIQLSTISTGRRRSVVANDWVHGGCTRDIVDAQPNPPGLGSFIRSSACEAAARIPAKNTLTGGGNNG